MLAHLLRSRARPHDRDPHDTDPWEWARDFYPGSYPKHQSDTAATFEQARADFERAWQVFLSNRTEADFQARFKEAPSSGTGYVIGGHKTTK